MQVGTPAVPRAHLSTLGSKTAQAEGTVTPQCSFPPSAGSGNKGSEWLLESQTCQPPPQGKLCPMPGLGYSREPEVTPWVDRQHMGGCSTCRDGGDTRVPGPGGGA